jgi:peptide/nickel transport system ATP-binding protein
VSRELLRIEDLQVHFRRRTLKDLMAGTHGDVRAVNGVSLELAQGETLGLVGESGCGKSTLGRAILRLAEPTAGRIVFDGDDLAGMDAHRLLQFRRRAQMIFQDPFASLNPRLTVRETLAEVYRVHAICEPSQIEPQIGRLLDTVGLSRDLLDRRPASLSGGQCQRVGIARALALSPKLLVADEAVSALDTSIQAQILNLIGELQRELQLAMVFISHDLGVVRYLCRRTAVMYLGRIVELGPTEQVFSAPKHPYTQALVAAIPRVDLAGSLPEGLPGEPPSPTRIPAGCAFHPRCTHAMACCRQDPPPSMRDSGPSQVACHLYAAEAAEGDRAGVDGERW